MCLCAGASPLSWAPLGQASRPWWQHWLRACAQGAQLLDRCAVWHTSYYTLLITWFNRCQYLARSFFVLPQATQLIARCKSAHLFLAPLQQVSCCGIALWPHSVAPKRRVKHNLAHCLLLSSLPVQLQILTVTNKALLCWQSVQVLAVSYLLTASC